MCVPHPLLEARCCSCRGPPRAWRHTRPAHGGQCGGNAGWSSAHTRQTAGGFSVRSSTLCGRSRGGQEGTLLFRFLPGRPLNVPPPLSCGSVKQVWCPADHSCFAQLAGNEFSHCWMARWRCSLLPLRCLYHEAVKPWRHMHDVADRSCEVCLMEELSSCDGRRARAGLPTMRACTGSCCFDCNAADRRRSAVIWCVGPAGQISYNCIATLLCHSVSLQLFGAAPQRLAPRLHAHLATTDSPPPIPPSAPRLDQLPSLPDRAKRPQSTRFSQVAPQASFGRDDDLGRGAR